MPLSDIINVQNKHKIDLAGLRAFVGELIANVSETDGSSFAVAIVDDERMKKLNEIFRDKSVTTDVLSFPNEPDDFDPDKTNLGDIVISAEQASRQATENGLSFEAELKQLILHGVLHLCGYDHETDNGEMDARELELRKELRLE